MLPPTWQFDVCDVRRVASELPRGGSQSPCSVPRRKKKLSQAATSPPMRRMPASTSHFVHLVVNGSHLGHVRRAVPSSTVSMRGLPFLSFVDGLVAATVGWRRGRPMRSS